MLHILKFVKYPKHMKIYCHGKKLKAECIIDGFTI